MCAQYFSAVAAQATGYKPHAIKMEDALTAKREISEIPAIPAVWKDTLMRLQQTDPELFEYRPGSCCITRPAAA